MKYLSIDIETFSDQPLKDVGVYKYTDTPHFEILLFAYAIDEGPVEIVDLASGETIPKSIEKAIFDTSIIKNAFNAQFERVCLSKHYGVKYLDPEGWHCTMVKAATLGISGTLDNVSKVLGFEINKQKLFTGKNLIRLFSVPRKAKKDDEQTRIFEDKIRLMPEDRPEEWQQFREYCIQDVVVEKEVKDKLSRFEPTPEELAMWYLDQKINDYGVRLDIDFATKAVQLDSEYKDKLVLKYQQVTGLSNPKSVAELKKWLSVKLGQEVTSLTKETLPDLMKAAKDIPEAKEALQIRVQTSKTSVSKYTKMQDVICSDMRARGLLQFYGAGRTGRWAGRQIQVQNLPQNKINDLDTAREIVNSGDLELLEMCYPSVPAILSQLIRTALIPSDGHRFIVSDFSAIEARVIAWLAGEQWRIDVFNTHGKIYEASASAMFKVPLEEIHKGHPLRQKGKVAELACGYQGGVGALKAMDKKWAENAPEEELKELISNWRKANPKIVSLWYEVEAAAIKAIEERTTVEMQHGLKFIYQPGILFIQLPSKRRIAYVKPKLEDHEMFQGKTKITFEGMDQTSNTWVRIDTYGGKLVENIVQAIARDCLRDSMIRLDAAGYKIALHVHDEAVLDVPSDSDKSLAEAEQIMAQPLDWAPGLPLNADGFECEYYMKD